MRKIIKIGIHKLTIKGFEPFGQVILGAEGSPNYVDANWKSLFPTARINLPGGELGWVITKKPKNGMIVSGMEREPEMEMIWPTDKPIIQIVSLPGDLKDHKEQPDAKNAKAFLIKPGQVIIMHPGTWHFAAFPADSAKAFYYFATKDHPREKGWEDVAWIPFKDCDAIEIN